MALAIHRSTPAVIRKDMVGWPVFALQRSLNKGWGTALVEDMVFGANTEKAVKLVQGRLGQTVDGVAGHGTQSAMARFLCGREEAAAPSLPDGLLTSQVNGESTSYIAAVAWGSRGGVDCGWTQRRVYETDYDDEAVIERAFDGPYQIGLLADRLLELYSIFRARAGTKQSWQSIPVFQFAWRLAILNHNYPAAADRISRYGVSSLSSYWNTTQQWVVDATTYKDKDGTLRRVTFPDGSHINTPFQWCCRYSLGDRNRNEPGQMTKGVTAWG